MTSKTKSILLDSLVVVTFFLMAKVLVCDWLGALFLAISYFGYGVSKRASGWLEGVRYQQGFMKRLDSIASGKEADKKTEQILSKW